MKSLEVAKRLKAIGLERRAGYMANCSDTLVMRVCPDCGNLHVVHANLCRDRLCPLCGWRLALKRYANGCEMLEAATDLLNESQLCMLTLTIRSVPVSKLAATLDDLSVAFKRLQQLRYWRDNVSAWARSTEITYNSAKKTVHPHVHLLITAPPHMNLNEMRVMLSHLWDVSARLSYKAVIDLRQAYSAADKDSVTAAALEAFKYAIKSSDTLTIPLRSLRVYAAAIAGRRMVSYGGEFRRIRAQLGLPANDDSPDNDIDGRDVVLCDCGGNFYDALAKWSGVTGGYQLFASVADRSVGGKHDG